MNYNLVILEMFCYTVRLRKNRNKNGVLSKSRDKDRNIGQYNGIQSE